MGSPALLVSLGILFLAGLALESVGRRVRIPRVTLLIVLGALIGPPVLDLLPRTMSGSETFLAPTALTMVAFLLGGTLTRDTLASHGREIVVVSVTVVVISVAIVAGILAALGLPLALALLLGAMASSTAPAATQDVVRQSGVRSRFTINLLGIVAVDDAWGLLAFSAMLTLAGIVAGDGATAGALVHGLWEAGGAVALGLAIGLPAAVLTGRIKPGEPTLIEALGIVFLTAGVAMTLHVSYLLAGIVAGTTIANLARHHERPFHEIERIEWPFLLLFFVVAGASFHLGALEEAGLVCLAYILLRGVSRVIGGWTGARLARLPRSDSRLIGFALMPQAGVAIGMALVAAERFPDLADQILAVVIASTILFEIVGPLLTQMAIARSELAEAAHRRPHVPRSAR